jgi:hypothetical protein
MLKDIPGSAGIPEMQEELVEVCHIHRWTWDRVF